MEAPRQRRSTMDSDAPARRVSAEEEHTRNMVGDVLLSTGQQLSDQPSSGKTASSKSLWVQMLRKLGPLLVVLGSFVNTAEPYLAKATDAAMRGWKVVEPYHPEEFAQGAFGLFCAFFGGHYLLTIAAVEAYRLTGWEKTRKYGLILYHNYCQVREASRHDDSVDDDNDGIADVKQISHKQLFTRKLRLAMNNSDPLELSKALTGIWTGFMAVVANLRTQFAQVITLGASIGDIFYAIADRTLHPILKAAVPQQYHKWLHVGVRYGCRITGISIAWTVQRVISSFYSALRGGQLFAKGVLQYMGRMHITAPFDESSPMFVAVVAAVAIAGFWWQITTAFDMGFILNLLFFPITIAEWVLTWFVAIES